MRVIREVRTHGVISRSRVLRWCASLLPVMAVAVALGSCSTKKNTAASRNYQAFITRYNVYFNGDEHYKETLRDMETSYEDDFTGPLLLHPAEAYAVPSAPQPSGSFTRSIEKAQKAIQLHSIKKRPRRTPGKSGDPEYRKWLKREEYNPFLHNAWLMMGRSQYMNGDFLGAASTFHYISRHFSWLPATVTEARLWEARCYCALGWLYEAEVIISRVKDSQLVNRQLRELYSFTSADFYIRSKEYDRAIPYLREAVRLSSRSQKSRLYFVLGRVCALAGRNSEAYEAYGKAAGAGGTSSRARFNARIKQSEVYTGSDISREVKALRRMARYGSNREYLDQIHYAIGNLYLSRRDTLSAVKAYREAIARSTRDGIDKAIAQVSLGDLYYRMGRYDEAQPLYAEGVPVLPETYPGYAAMRRRSDVLDELAVYTRNVALNDSLLRLAEMPENARLKVIDGIISRLRKQEQEEAENARREEYLSRQEAAAPMLNAQSAGTPQEFKLNTDKSWYFYNTATRNAGRTDFQRRWGARKLEDDWRRRDKSSFAFQQGDDDEAEQDAYSVDDASGLEADTLTVDRRARISDPHFREYYLSQLPFTDIEKVTANDVIQEGLYNAGLILKDRMEDFPAARREWDRLMARYPDNVYRLDVYHNLYLMYMRLGQDAEAEIYRKLILGEFPDSRQAAAMKDPAYIDRLRAMEAGQEALYEQAYADYMADRNEAVHEARKKAGSEYPMSPLMPKFMFLDALAYVTENKPAEFNAVLTEILERYPDVDVAPLAASWHKGLREGRKLHSSGSNVRGMLWETRLTNDSIAGEDGEVKLNFTLAPDEPHYMVLLFPADEVSSNRLLYDVARHNFSTYVIKDFDLEVMNFGPLGLVIVKGFDNRAEVDRYRTRLSRDGDFVMPAGVRPVEISKRNFEELMRGHGSFEDYFRFIDDASILDTHRSVLPPDTYPPPSEMYPPPDDADGGNDSRE